jgi:putative ABC transport system permease protein
MKSFRKLFRLERTAADVNRSIDDELAFHFEQTIQDLIATGMTPEAARAEADRRFGDRRTAEQRMAYLDRQRIGSDRRAAWWAAIAQDAKYAVRGLRMRPAFAATIIITLGLGIGANAAMFGIVDRLLFRPPAYLKNPGRTHRVFFARTFDGKERFSENTTYKRVLEIDSLTTSFARTAAYFVSEVAIGSGVESRERPVFGAGARFFEFFDAPPVLGRYFGRSEDSLPIGAPVAVLSYAFWQGEYGGRRDVINETIKVGTETFTIIGVAPPGLGVEFATKPVLLIIPITRMASVLFGPDGVPLYYNSHSYGWVSLIAEREEGVSVETASSDLTNAFRRSYAAQVAESPGTTLASIAKPRALAAPIHKDRGPNPRADSQVAKWLEGVALVVLLIACANVANLLLARAVQRRREIAVRLALGVNRGRLIAQLLTESILLAGLGGLTGLAIAQWGGAALRAAFLPEADWSANIIDPRTIVFTLVISMIAGIISGLAPALYSGRGDVSGALKSGAREGTLHKSRTRTTLLIMQGALSVILLVGAGLFVRSLLNVRSLHMGFDVEQLLAVTVDMRGTTLPLEQRGELRRRLLARAKELPAVQNAARALTIPFYMTISGDVRIAGVDTSARWLREVTRQAGSQEYFETTGTRIVRGRGFDASDVKGGALSIVVSEALAKAAWPGKDALGQCVRMGSDTNPCRTVVGIAENVMLGSLREPETYHYYLPIDQYLTGNSGSLFVRVRGRGASQVESVRRGLQQIMPGTSYVNVVPLSDRVAPETKSWRLGATMFVIFGALALGLAAIGLYSVIAYGVTQRQHELGVRVALGAQSQQILSLILRQGMVLAFAGVSIGTLIAISGGKWIKPLLYNVSPTDPLVFSGVIGVLVLTALAACIVPARRAASVDPNVALRSD